MDNFHSHPTQFCKQLKPSFLCTFSLSLLESCPSAFSKYPLQTMNPYLNARTVGGAEEHKANKVNTTHRVLPWVEEKTWDEQRRHYYSLITSKTTHANSASSFPYMYFFPIVLFICFILIILS